MRGLLLAIALLGLLLAALGGCESVGAEATGGSDSDGDSDGDSDSDSDTDTGGVPIEYPEALNPFLNPNSLMTGPISPPPEDVLDAELEGEGEPDGGEPDGDLDQDPGDDSEDDEPF